ncbi:MAG: argininosuccinate synthase [Armatimonadota bacterium]|nr:argininosuccinate synthase [Armatimonadota bacterium]MDR7421940.1 argininosuccinate synthase [Armatimonadota bacterium]MDR7453524.1 argininosuccinate synthase [Armatimonadota bacterium]MDR7457824.1 argininosuccinate synthase [Armatimonadota bacterium]MDR7495597.1 argininosuccinate synthase [Armatimonadota bacterium]
MTVHKIALAYSGGLDTSVAIPWLRETYGAQVVAVIVDIGQGEDLAAVRDKALASGAVAAHVVDVRRTFVTDYLVPMVQAGAVYEGRYMLGTAIARPLIAKTQVEVALAEGADALAHGCTGKGNDQVRFELAYQALAPQLAVIAPWRQWHIRSREQAIEYAERHGVPVTATRARPYSVDRNLWHCSSEAGILEDIWAEPPDDLYQYTDDPRTAPDDPEYVEIEFEEGRPVALDGARLDPLALMERLNAAGRRHGVGRIDMVENRLVGMKTRGVYETPGGTILHVAHRDLEAITVERDCQHYKLQIGPRYAELVYYGQWFSPLRQAFDAFVASTQRTVTGSVRVKLFKGSAMAVGRRSPQSLYDMHLATFGEDAVYDQRDAGGFIALWGLPTRVFAQANPRLIRSLREPVR